jgi:hypothetical protein
VVGGMWSPPSAPRSQPPPPPPVPSDFKTSNMIHSNYALQLGEAHTSGWPCLISSPLPPSSPAAAYMQAVSEMVADGDLDVDGLLAQAPGAVPTTAATPVGSGLPPAPHDDSLHSDLAMPTGAQSAAVSGHHLRWATLRAGPLQPSDMEGVVVRIDKRSGEVEVKRLTSWQPAFDAFKACLLLWHSNTAPLLQRR